MNKIQLADKQSPDKDQIYWCHFWPIKLLTTRPEELLTLSTDVPHVGSVKAIWRPSNSFYKRGTCQICLEQAFLLGCSGAN